MEQQANTIDLRRLWALCRQHVKLFIFWTIGLGVVAYLLAAFVIPAKYTATTQILVNQKDNNQNGQAYANQQADVNMINTYKDIITNQVILNAASSELASQTRIVTPAKKAKYETLADGTKKLVSPARPAVRRAGKAYDLSAADLKKSLSVKTQANSQVFALSATASDPAEAKDIANTVATKFKSRIKSIMNVNNVTIVSKASTPTTPSFPRPKLFTLAGAALGFILSFAWVLIRDLTNTTIRDASFLTDELGLTNLGQIGKIKMAKDFTLNHFDENKGTRRV